MSNRFKSFGLGAKRKSSANPTSYPQDAPPSLGTGSPQLPPLPQTPNQRISASSSASSIPMNPPPGPGQRPPSYTAGYPPGAPMGAGRTTSPPGLQGPARTPPTQVMGGPPPINTHTAGGYPPQQGPPPMAGPPPLAGGPPGYGGQPYPGPHMGGIPGPAQYARNNAVEVEGGGRSKSQLIVGIDFVCHPSDYSFLA
jgi:hypothetical protein